jgi:hypothetical protein
MVENDVSSAFEILLEEIENIIEELNQEGAKQFTLSEHKKARELLEKVELVTAFRGKVKQLQNDWRSMEVQIKQGAPSDQQVRKRKKKAKLQKGLRTPEEEYRTPILEILKQLGGSASANEVLSRVGKRMAGILNDYDKQPLPSTPSSPRWRNTAQWTRAALVSEGLMAKDSPKGIWELAGVEKKAALEPETAWNEVPLFSEENIPKVLQHVFQVYSLVKSGKVGYNEAARQITKEQGLRSINSVYDACTRRINLTTAQFLDLLNDNKQLQAHLLRTFPTNESLIKWTLSKINDIGQ